MSIDTGRGSTWDTERAAERVERAYLADDLARIRRGLIALLAPQPGERILDIGCGPGIFAAELQTHGAEVTALDSSPAMLAAVERHAPTVERVEGEAMSLPFPDGAFDAVTIVQVLEYVADPVAAIREAARVVRPGGRLLVADSDWETATFDIDDTALARRALDAWCATKVHGRAGRHLRGWLVAAGLEPIATAPQVLLSGRLGDTFLAHNWSYFRRGIAQSGQLSDAELRQLDSELDASEAAGRALFSMVRHAWIGGVR